MTLTFFIRKPFTYNGDLNVDLADIDLDGDMDMLVCNYNPYIFRGGSIEWYENYGGGIFAKAKTISTEVNGFFIQATDLDGDGDKDILTFDGDIIWYENVMNEPAISVLFYFDINGNGIKEDSEVILKNQIVELLPTFTSYYSDDGGLVFFYLPENTYTLKAKFDSCWTLTTDSLNYKIIVEDNIPTQQIAFGLQVTNVYKHTQTRIISNFTRCGFEVPFQLSIENDGCQPTNGQYGLVLSPLVTLLDTEIEPTEIRGDTLLWNHDELIASETADIQLTFEIAGTDFIGEFIQMIGLSYIENEQGELELSSTYDYQSEIRCTYDPNDKLVHPNRLQQYSDSTNEPLSHGFVTYKIRPKQDLSESTAIENTASIYFDFNPPIVTNTTQNVMVSEFPQTTSTGYPS